MVVAEDVVSYFQSLKSYERIWIMCKLQHSCLPFELRFLGTCLEELGRKDFNHLRPVENEANSNAEINIAELRKISDKDVQPKIILYLSLLHSHNYACSNSLYKILCDSNEVNTFLKYEDERDDNFEQLLMIYTLAVNHPAFSCEQKRVLLSIFTELQGEESKRTSLKDGVPQPSVGQSDNPSFTSTIQVQECQSQISTPPENTVIAQSLPNPSHIATIPPPYAAHDLSIPVHEQIGLLPAHSYVRFLPPTSWSGATAIPGVGIVLTTSEQTTTTHTPFLSRSSSPSISNAPSRSSSPSAKARPLSAPFARSPQLTGILPPQPASLPLPQTTVDPFVEMIHKDSSPLPVNAPTYPSEQLYRRSDEELSALGMTEDSIQSLRCMVVNNKRLSSDDSLSTPSVDKVTPNDPGTEALKEFIEKSVPTSYNVYTAAIPGPVDPSYQVTHPYVCVYCHPNNGQPLNGFVAPANAEIACLEHDMNVLRLEADVPSRNSNGSNSDSNSSEQSSPPNTPVLPQNNFNKRSNKHNANNESGVNNNHNNNNNNNSSSNSNNNNNIDERSNAGDSSSEERHSAPQTSYQARGRIINNRGRSKNQNSFPRGRGTNRRRNENMNGNNEEVKKPNYSGANAEGASFQYSTNPIAAVTNATTYVHPPQYLRCYNTFPANSYMRAPSHHHPYTSNEVIYHQYPPPQHIFPGAIPYTPVVLPASKVSCYNCGSPAHMANECRDSTLEELNKNGQYRLDFTPVEGTLEK